MAKKKYNLISRYSKAGKLYKRKKIVDLVSELVLGKKRYKYSKERKETMKTVTDSRRKLNKIKKKLGK